MNAFDTDVLIYAAMPSHPLGSEVAALLTEGSDSVGSVMLLPELLIKPTRADEDQELTRLLVLLAHIDLLDVTPEIASHAVSLGAKYGLRAVDGVHLATAVVAGADRFITNNQRDFPTSITEIDVVYPADL